MGTRKYIIKIFLSFIVLLLFPSIIVKAENANYTYTYDYWAEERESPDAYTAETFITGLDIGIGNFKSPQGMYVRGNLIYICDTGNNRIVILQRNGDTITFKEEIVEFKGNTEITTFSEPNDIFVSDSGEIYICDTKNQRILHLDKNRNLVKEIIKPQDENIDTTAEFYPTKLVVDTAGRIFALVKNYNKGFLKFEQDGKFTGYIGANEVKFNALDYAWKMLATKEQRGQMAQFVPTEYNNLAVDNEGFIYATTSVFEEYQLLSDTAKPIRKLNTMGTDILIKNGNFPPIGDIDWGNAGGISGPSRLVDVTATDDDTYYAVDRTRGRIFGYDTQGNLLYAFGGLGSKIGYFQDPIAIDHMEKDLLVLDSKSGGITVFTLTEYGELINKAIEEYKQGHYEVSGDYWKQVLMYNGNYDLAYIGIGRSLMRQEQYKEAMEYFKLKWDDKNYSKAFKLYRKQWIEDNIVWLFIGGIGLFGIVSTRKVVKKLKGGWEENEYC